jgi:hypothetical protein
MVEGMLASGQHDPDAYASILRKHPEAKSEILEVLHGSLGNAFVQSVVTASEKEPADKPKAEKGHVLVENEGKWEDLKGHGGNGKSYAGFSKYGGGKVRDKLVELTNSGQLKLTPAQIAVFDAVSQVETGGQIGCVQTYDDQVVSVGFKQVVLGYASLEKMMVKAPAGFAKHGLQLDFSKTYKKSGWSNPHQIVGCPDVEELRSPEWAIKFYHASMEPDVIGAMCELLAHEQGIVNKSIDQEGGVNEDYFDDATAQSWLLECYNNRPAFTAKAIARAGKKAAASRDAFLDMLSDAIIETYVVEEPKLAFNKAKKAAEKKGTKLTAEQETKLLEDMKKKYEPIGRKKGTNIVTKIGRKVTPPKLNATSAAPATAAPATAAPAKAPATPAPTPAAAPITTAAPIEAEHVEIDAEDVPDAPVPEAPTTAPATAAPAIETAPAAPVQTTKAPEVADTRVAPVVEAAATHTPQPFRVTATGLNVRAAANAHSDIVGGLKHGDVIDVTGHEGKWMQTTHDSQPAYVHGHYVEPAEGAKAETAAEVEAPKPKQPAKDAASHTTRPPKAQPPSQRADETPYWYDEETAKAPAKPAAPAHADAQVDPNAIGKAVVESGKAALDWLEEINPFDGVGSGSTAATPAAKPATAAKPAAPAATTTAKPAASTTSPVGALTPADLHNESLERMVSTMNNAKVTAIAGELAGLTSKSKELKKKLVRHEEQGQGRDDLVEGIRVLRGKLDGLAAEHLDKQQLTAFKTAVYHALNEIAPYYFQCRNVDILETPPYDQTRTCNLTCLGMALESLGRNPTMFTGSQDAVIAAARVYQHKLVGDGISDPAQDAMGGRGTSWTNLTGMRFPDFLELAAIANEMKGDNTDEGVKAGAKAAWDQILVWGNLIDLAKLFKVNAKQKLFDVTGTKNDRKKKTKHDYVVLKEHGDKNRMAVEKFINAQNDYEAKPDEKHKEKVEKLRPAYEAAIGNTGMDDRVDLEGYRAHLVEHVGADLDSGAAVIVGLSGHFVRLQAINADHVLVNDPGRDSRSLTKLTFAEARAMGYFATRFVLS